MYLVSTLLCLAFMSRSCLFLDPVFEGNGPSLSHVVISERPVCRRFGFLLLHLSTILIREANIGE